MNLVSVCGRIRERREQIPPKQRSPVVATGYLNVGRQQRCFLINSDAVARADERPEAASRTREGRRERPEGVSGEAGEV
jgi:hypothetical protein